MDVLNDSSMRHAADKVQLLAGRITEVGEDYLILLDEQATSEHRRMTIP
jgi:hypothetical protein